MGFMGKYGQLWAFMGSMDLNGQVRAFLGSCKEEWVFVRKYVFFMCKHGSLLKVWVLGRVCFF